MHRSRRVENRDTYTSCVPTDDPLLSVIIPTLGRPSLAEQLAALQLCQWDATWEVVVANNSSSPLSPRLLPWSRADVELTVLEASGIRGRSHAVNTAARQARGRWMLLCDDDDIVFERFVQTVGDAFRTGATAVSFNVDVRTSNPDPAWQSIDFRALEEQRPMLGDLPALWGCCGIDRATFRSLGGYDETLLYAEDLDLTHRYHQAGLPDPIWVQERLLRYHLPNTPATRFAKARAYAIARDRMNRKLSRTAGTTRRGHALLSLLGVAAGSLPSIGTRYGRMSSADRLGRAVARIDIARERRTTSRG